MYRTNVTTTIQVLYTALLPTTHQIKHHAGAWARKKRTQSQRMTHCAPCAPTVLNFFRCILTLGNTSNFDPSDGLRHRLLARCVCTSPLAVGMHLIDQRAHGQTLNASKHIKVSQSNRPGLDFASEHYPSLGYLVGGTQPNQRDRLRKQRDVIAPVRQTKKQKCTRY